MYLFHRFFSEAFCEKRFVLRRFSSSKNKKIKIVIKRKFENHIFQIFDNICVGSPCNMLLWELCFECHDSGFSEHLHGKLQFVSTGIHNTAVTSLVCRNGRSARELIQRASYLHRVSDLWLLTQKEKSAEDYQI